MRNNDISGEPNNQQIAVGILLKYLKMLKQNVNTMSENTVRTHTVNDKPMVEVCKYLEKVGKKLEPIS